MRRLLICASVFLLSACESNAVNRLSAEAGDASLAFSIELSEFGRFSRNTGEARARAISGLSVLVATDKAEFKREISLYKSYVDPAPVTLLNAIKTQSIDMDKIMNHTEAYTVEIEVNALIIESF